jgi:hypothetical protein
MEHLHELMPHLEAFTHMPPSHDAKFIKEVDGKFIKLLDSICQQHREHSGQFCPHVDLINLATGIVKKRAAMLHANKVTGGGFFDWVKRTANTVMNSIIKPIASILPIKAIAKAALPMVSGIVGNIPIIGSLASKGLDLAGKHLL